MVMGCGLEVNPVILKKHQHKMLRATIRDMSQVTVVKQ